jgi:hypothetical protein
MSLDSAVRLGAAEVVWVDPLCLADRMQLAAERKRIPWLAHPVLAIACENPRRFLSRRPAAFDVVALAAPVVGWTAPLDVHDLEAPLYTAEGARALKNALAPGGVLMLPRYLVTDRNAAVVRQGALEAGMSPERIMVDTKEAIIADLLPRLTADHWVLVKGSRGMAMESVVAAIQHQTPNGQA